MTNIVGNNGGRNDKYQKIPCWVRHSEIQSISFAKVNFDSQLLISSSILRSLKSLAADEIFLQLVVYEKNLTNKNLPSYKNLR